MRVIALKVDLERCPAELRPYLGQSFTTVRKDYLVHALVLFEGHVFIQIIDDLDNPSWRPFWQFDLADSSIPEDWICGAFHGEPQLVVGPEFIAKDPASYAGMVELEMEQVSRFWARIKSMSHDK